LRVKTQDSDQQTAEQDRETSVRSEQTCKRCEERDRLLSWVMHEIRNPVLAIVGFSELVLEDEGISLPKRLREDIEAIRSNSQHLYAIVDGVLDLSKIAAGRMALNVRETHLTEIAARALATTTALVQEGVELRSEIAPGLGPIQVDPVRINQVLLNLLSNAAKFTREGAITLRAWREDGTACVSVTDTGEGIPADRIDSIFGEFYHAAAEHGYAGTGLGLPIARKLIEMHGGRLWVQSTVGVGTTFSFSLPIRES